MASNLRKFIQVSPFDCLASLNTGNLKEILEEQGPFLNHLHLNNVFAAASNAVYDARDGRKSDSPVAGK